ncbi:MAG TPA: ATP-binding protein [Moraxellaceae bacterium]|nr:ATP-binding protein [Moraxellaceae bacterium]
MELTGKEREDWRLLRIYAWYRLLLSLLLLALFALKPLLPMLGGSNPPLFFATALGYLVTTITASVFLRRPRRQVAPFSLILLILDLLVLTLMTHASGGLNTQLSMLFLVTIAAGNILLAGRLGAMVAAIAAICIVYEQFYFSLSTDDSLSALSLLQSSILGISFFAVAMFSQLIVRRMRQGEELAESRARDIADLQRLNEQIIRRMRTGIIAVSADRKVLMCNDASRHLLGLHRPIPMFSELADVSVLLDGSLHAWLQNPTIRLLPFKSSSESPEVTVNFARLSPSDGDRGTVLVFLEDNSQLAQQAQKLKLGSLGRLTASIAHEVRNPLGAISHATQLLVESPDISGPDRRLLEIIEQHCRRVNAIIENVLSVSRRHPTIPQTFELEEWLLQFRDDFLGLHRSDDEIELQPPEPGLLVRFDPEQLRQVLTNLVANGLRYSRKQTGRGKVWLEAGRTDPIGLPFVDVIDNGAGLTDEQRSHLFEPFFTTETQGTGLGLYLSREICEANQARLDYIPRDQGTCFRVTFAHPDRLT